MAIFRMLASLTFAVAGFLLLAPSLGFTFLRPSRAAKLAVTAGWPVYAALGAAALLLVIAAWQLARNRGRTLPLCLALFLIPNATRAWFFAPLALPLLYLLTEAAWPWLRRATPTPAHFTSLTNFRRVAACLFGFYAVTPFVLLTVMRGFLNQEYQKQFDRAAGLEFYATFAGIAILFGTAAYQMWHSQGRGFAWFAAVIISPFSFMGWMGVVFVTPLLTLAAEALAPRFAAQPLSAETQAKSQRSQGQLVEWLVTIPVIFGVAFLFRSMPGVITPKDAESSFLNFALYTWLIILVHELGHALAGKSQGFDWMAFMVTPIEVQRIGGRTSFKWNFSLGGHYCGFPRTADNLWRRHLIMVAGGPAVNIATFLLVWAVLVAAQGRIGGEAFGFLRGLMNWSLITAIINLIPATMGPLKTDGRYIWDAFFAPSESRKAMAIYGCMVSRSSLLRPREWQREWVHALREAEPDMATAALLSAWAQDQLLADPADLDALECLARSTEDLERLAATLPPAGAAAIRFHVDWLRVRHDGIVQKDALANLAIARKDKHVDPYELLRMEAALKLASGEPDDAGRLLDQAEQDIVKRQNGFRSSDLDDLRAFRQAALA